METHGMEGTNKRLKPTEDIEGVVLEGMVEEETQNHLVGSEEMENRINAILERIDRFTELVSEMLEAGKTMFKELSGKFEEQLIEIHTQQMEKWQEEIKDLRMLDASNEENYSLLQNTRSHLLQNFQLDS